MTFFQIAALLRRHFIAVAMVLAMAAAAGYRIETTGAPYVETASVVFTLTRHLADLNLSVNQTALLSKSLIATEATMAEAMSPSAAPAGVRTADGPARYTLVPFNSYNLEYPYYSLPSATLTVTSRAPAVTHQAFRRVFGLIAHRLAAEQARANVAPADRIRVYVAADTGPQPKPGSRVRVLAGMAALTTLAVFTVAGALDRRRKPAGRRRVSRNRPEHSPVWILAAKSARQQGAGLGALDR